MSAGQSREKLKHFEELKELLELIPISPAPAFRSRLFRASGQMLAARGSVRCREKSEPQAKAKSYPLPVHHMDE
jgi:hypothetical protein